MITRLLLELSMIPIALVYRAWGRCWLTDDQCRTLVTTIMRVTLIDGDASFVLMRMFEAGERSGRAACAVDNHQGRWDFGYLQGQDDGARSGVRRGRRQGAGVALAGATLVALAAGLAWTRWGYRQG